MRYVGVLLLSLAVLAGCGGDDAGRQGGQATAADPTASEPAPAADGVEVTGETLDGAPFSTADLRGKRVFVNVWASW